MLDVVRDNQIKILQNLSGGPNIVGLLDVVRDSQVSLFLSRTTCSLLTVYLQSKTPSLIFEYVNNTDFRSLYPKFADIDVRYYIFELLKVIVTPLGTAVSSTNHNLGPRLLPQQGHHAPRCQASQRYD